MAPASKGGRDYLSVTEESVAMRPIKRILVAVKEPTVEHSPAVAKAAQLASGLDAEVVLFHDIATPLYADMLYARGVDLKAVQREQLSRRRDQLEKIAARVREHGVKVSSVVEWDFPAAEAIVRQVWKQQADLVVADVHAGGKHRASWLLNYTDWELVRDCPAPVLLVKTKSLYRHPRVMASIDPLHAFAKPASLDKDILRAGSQLAHALKGELHAMHAFVPPMPILPPLAMGPIVSVGTPRDESEAEARKRFMAELGGFEVKRSARHLVAGRPADVIPQVAKSAKANIVVMGALSRSGLKRFFIGNTAEAVIDALPCDVLVVKHSRFATKIPRASRGVQVLATPITP
jgi:universal stress protein E